MFNMTTDTLFIYFCGKEQCAPGHAFGPAVRPHYLIHVVLKGKGIYKRKNKTYFLEAGDAFLISPMESTYYKADETEPWEYAWVGFDGTSAGTLLAQTCFRDSCIYRNRPDTSSVDAAASILFSIMDCFRQPGHNPLTLNGLFLQLLGTMDGAAAPEGGDYSKQYLDMAKKYMTNNYGYNIRISDIAASIGIDRTYLYRIFMKEEHVSPKQYLLQLRLRNATNMLRSSKYSVTEIAFSCGFRDTAAFCNQFKSSTGFTPKQFQRYIKDEMKYGLPPTASS